MKVLLQSDNLDIQGRLRNASLSIAEGELVCLVGPNGSGKTSLLQAIAGIETSSGTVDLAGTDPRHLGPGQRPSYLAYLPATRDLPWPLLARDVIALGGGSAVFPELELGHLLDRRVDTLSTGERSRILLARALAPRPRLLLLDEPTANLDPLWQLRLMALVRAEICQNGRSALVAIHDLAAAERFADRILVIDKGEIVAEGLSKEVLAGVFGIIRSGGQWEAALNPPEDQRSSR